MYTKKYHHLEIIIRFFITLHNLLHSQKKAPLVCILHLDKKYYTIH